MSHYTSFTADTLKNSNAKLQEIEANVADIIRSLNMEIKDAHDAGSEYIDSTITNIFSIPHMKPEDAAIRIHYRIVSNFHDRGFRVYIEDQDTRTRIVIAWFTRGDITQMKKEKAFLDFCRVPFDKRQGTK